MSSKVQTKTAPVKKTATPKKTVAAPPVVEAPVVVAPVVVEVAPVEVVDAPEVVTLETQFKDVIASLNDYIKGIKGLESNLKNLKIQYQKELKDLKKNKKRTRKSSANAVPHGFVKEVKISNDLADFLNMPHGSMIARPKVTSAISKYVKEHDLALPENRAIFKTDAALEKILGKPTDLAIKSRPDYGIQFSYFNINKSLKTMNHFIKEEIAV